MIREPVNTDKLQAAIVMWEAAMEVFRNRMRDIKKRHKLTWWARKEYWANEKLFHKYFTALMKRRTQLQTALKENSK